MSDAPAPAPLRPVTLFLKEKAEKVDAIKNEVKTLLGNLKTLRQNNADGAAKKEAYKLIHAKRAEYKTVRKSRFTPTV